MKERSELSSKSSMLQSLVPEGFSLNCADKKLKVSVEFSEDGKVLVSSHSEDGAKNIHLLPGDTCVLDHVIHVDTTKEIEPDHFFPLKIPK